MKKEKPIIILDRVIKPLKRTPEYHDMSVRDMIRNIVIFFDTLEYWLERHNSLDNGKT